MFLNQIYMLREETSAASELFMTSRYPSTLLSTSLLILALLTDNPRTDRRSCLKERTFNPWLNEALGWDLLVFRMYDAPERGATKVSSHVLPHPPQGMDHATGHHRGVMRRTEHIG